MIDFNPLVVLDKFRGGLEEVRVTFRIYKILENDKLSGLGSLVGQEDRQLTILRSMHSLLGCILVQQPELDDALEVA